MAKKDKTMTSKKVKKAEKKPVENKSLKAKPENKYKGYVLIDGKQYPMGEAKAKELVKRGTAKY